MKNFQKEKKGATKIKRKILVSLLLIVIIATSYFIFFSNLFQINVIEIKETENSIDVESIKKETENLLQKNIFLADTQEWKKKIESAHPEIKSVKIRKILPKKIQLEIELHPIVANLINRFEGFEKKFELSQHGFTMIENIENPELPYIVITSEKSFKIKTQVIEKEKLQYALDAIKKFEEQFQMKIIDAQYLRTEREIHLKTEKLFKIWLDMEKDLEKQLNKLKDSLPQFDIYNLPLEYIDLRIEGTGNTKIFYKEL